MQNRVQSALIKYNDKNAHSHVRINTSHMIFNDKMKKCEVFIDNLYGNAYIFNI